MKHIIFIKGKLTDESYLKIEDTLSNTRLDYSLSKITQSLTVEGSNDVVYLAKACIEKAGYEVE